VARRKHLKDLPVTSLPITTRALWIKHRLRLEALTKEQRIRRQELEPLFYGAPDLLFPKGHKPGVWDPQKGHVVREPLGYDETDEQYQERQNRAVYELVTEYLTVVKDDKIIKIRAIPKMAKILADLFYGRVQKLILWANRGGGKCNRIGTKVLRADGRLVNVEDVRPGDRLMGPDGRGRNVLATSRGYGPLYEIVPVKGEPWSCNLDHVLTLVKHGHRGDGGTVIDISLRDFLAHPKTFRDSYKLFSVGVDSFEPDPALRPLKIDPYFLGVWFGDGTKMLAPSVHNEVRLVGVEITKADPEIRDLCVQTAKDWGLACRIEVRGRNCFRFRIVGGVGQPNTLLEILRETVGSAVTIPDAVLRSPRQTRLEFLAGFLDTDGELHNNGYTLTQKREDWARAVWWIARSLGFMAVIRTRLARDQNGTEGTYYVVSISGDCDQIPLRIARKKASPRKQRKAATRTGITVEPIGEGDYYGFELDGDGRFLLGDFTVTHNSLLAAVYMWIAFVYLKKSSLNLGGCLLPGSFVWTTDGFAPVEETQPRQVVLGLSGALTEVVARPERFWSGEVVRVSGWGWGPGNVFTPDHRLLVVRNAFPEAARTGRPDWVRAGSGTPEWVPAGDVVPSDGLYIPRPAAPTTPMTLTPAMCRLVGLWAAEGSIVYQKNKEGVQAYGQIEFSLGAERAQHYVDDVVATVKNELGRVGTLERDRFRDGKQMRLQFGHTEFARWLEDTVHRGAKNKTLMNLLPDADDQQVQALLTGLFWGDGCFKRVPSRASYIASYTTISPGLAASAYYAALRLGLAPQIGLQAPRSVKNQPLWSVSFTGPDAVWLAKNVFFWEPCEPGVSRARPVVVTDKAVIVKVRGVERFDHTGPVYDLTVPSGSSFGMIGVHAHNSGNQARRVYDYTKQFWHCVLPGTGIITDRGLVPIEAVTNQHCVLAKDGQFHRVVEPRANWKRCNVVRVTHVGGDVAGFSVTEDHKVLTARGWVQAGSLTTDDRLVFPRIRRRDRVGPMVLRPAWASSWKRGRLSRTSIHTDSLLIEDLGAFGRLVGYWLAEGYFPGGAYLVGFVFGRHEVATHVADVCRLAESLFGVKPTVDHPQESASRVRFSSRMFCDWLRVNCKRGARNKVIPFEWLSGVDDATLSQTILGMWRGAGHMDLKRWALDYNTVSKDLALSVWIALNRLGYWATFSQYDVLPSDMCPTEGRIAYRVRLDGQPARNLMDQWGVSYPKPKRVNTWGSGVVVEPDRFLVPCESVVSSPYSGPVYDIGVEDEHSFACVGAVLHNSFPGMHEGMLSREPLLQQTELKNGSRMVCATSVSTAIGEHVANFVADEACTDRPGADHDLARAMQGAMSEQDHAIFLLSTFHLPTGFFCDTWDNAADMGFERVTWDCFDSMQRCSEGLELATPDDPQAVEAFCKKSCPLSWQEPTSDVFGNVTGSEWVGCCGKARTSEGWHTREQVMDEQRINKGTRIFEVEHMCRRPTKEGQIYNRALIDATLVDTFNLKQDVPKVIGLDWGLTQCALTLVGEWIEDNPDDAEFPHEGVGVVDVVYMSNRLVDAVVDQIQRWQTDYGDNVIVRADGSHPYNNRELAVAGYEVRPVRGDPKQMGKDNTARWIGSGLLKILNGFTLFVAQLHNLRQHSMTGKQVKQNRADEEGDHGPDALRFALMEYDYVKWAERRKLAFQRLVESRTRKPLTPQQLRNRSIDGRLL
jgi:hypothetical protein